MTSAFFRMALILGNLVRRRSSLIVATLVVIALFLALSWPLEAANESVAANAIPSVPNSNAAIPAPVSAAPTIPPPSNTTPPTSTSLTDLSKQLFESDGARITSAVRTIGWFLIVGMLPTLAMMSTSFIRISIVFGVLRQALGAQWILSPQILTPLTLVLTCGIMAPTWRATLETVNSQGGMEAILAKPAVLQAAAGPIRDFMSRQIEHAGNGADVWLFLDYQGNTTSQPETYEDVSLDVLLSAYVLSELKTAFLIAFQIYLPFLVIDIVMSSLAMVVGLNSLPVTTISLPLKLLLFVITDGWHLVVESLMRSFLTSG